MNKRSSSNTYWTRVFIPCILVLLGFAFYLLFCLPQAQMISTESLFKAIKSLG